MLEQPLQQHRRRRPCRKRTPKNGNVLDISENVHIDSGPEKPRQDAGDIPGDTTARPQEGAFEATRKVKRRNSEVEEEISKAASASKRVCLGEMAHVSPPNTPQPRHPHCEPAAREAEEVIDVETLSVSSAGGLQGDRPEWSDIDPREPEESQELENSSCGEIIDVDGEDEDVDVDVPGCASLLLRPALPGKSL